jgi:hypothetical protein
MHAGFSFSYSYISLLLRQPLSIKKSYAGAIQPFNIFQIIDFLKFDPLKAAAMALCVNLGPKCQN